VRIWETDESFAEAAVDSKDGVYVASFEAATSGD
jgi:uncharacterized protein with FMN-binding domain